MAFKELPLNNRLLEQFDAELVSDAEGYNPNVQTMGFEEYETAEIQKGVETSFGKYYTRLDSTLEFNFEDPNDQKYEGREYTGNIWFNIKKANSNVIVDMQDAYTDALAALGGQFFTVDLSTHDISVGDVLIVELYYEKTTTLGVGGDTWEDYVLIYDIELNVIDETATEVGQIIYAPYVARILDINGNNIKVNQSWADFKEKLPNEIEGS